MFINFKSKDVNFMVSSVAPPCDKELDPQLKKLSAAHLMIYEGDSFKPIIKAIENANHEQLDKARLQFLHVTNEINDFYAHISFDILKDAMKVSSWNDVFHNFVQASLEQTLELKEKLEENPKSKKTALKFNSAMNYLSEGVIILEKFEEQNIRLFKEHKKIIEEYRQLAKQLDFMHEQLDNFYPNFKNNVLNSTDFKNNAYQSLLHQLVPFEDMDFRQLERNTHLIGQRDVLWQVVQGKREEFIEKKFYKPLNEEESKLMQKNILNLLNNYERVNSSGIINNLMLYVNALNFEQYRYNEKASRRSAESELQHRDEREMEYLKRIGKEKEGIKREQPKEEILQQIKEDKIFSDKFATGLNRLGSEIKEGINQIASSFGINLTNKHTSTLILKNANEDTIVGEINSLPDKILLIYKDKEHYHISQNAILMVLCSKQEIRNGIPKLDDEFRQKNWDSSSNFYSFNEMLCELKQEDIQKHLFGIAVNIQDETKINGVDSVLKIKSIKR